MKVIAAVGLRYPLKLPANTQATFAITASDL